MRPSLARRAVTVLVALGVCSVLEPSASANTKSKITVQEKRLKWLEGLAREKQAHVAKVTSSIRALSAEIRKSNAELDALDRRYQRHQDELANTMDYYASLRKAMSAAATEAYIRGPLSYLGVFLEARTISEANEAVHFTGVVLAQTHDLAAQTAHAARQIATLKAQDSAMIDRRAALLRRQRVAQDELLGKFADAQEKLEQIQAIREEVVGLLIGLRKQLRAEEIEALGGTMPYGQWAEVFLDSIRAPVVRSNLVAMVAWQLAEGTLARWNPLATTWKLPGSTSFNGSGVQDYLSVDQGLEATQKTLGRPGHDYEAVLSDLAAGASSMTTGKAINASDWCRGCADGQYVIELIPIVERYFDRYAKRRA